METQKKKTETVPGKGRRLWITAARENAERKKNKKSSYEAAGKAPVALN